MKICTFFQSEASYFQWARQNSFMNRFSKNTVFNWPVVAEKGDMLLLKIDIETKFLHIIKCRGPSLVLRNIYSSVVLGV